MLNYIIRNEVPADYRTVENLTREAFWNIYRPGCLEHYVLHRFRDRADFVPELDLIMEIDGKIMGHVMYARSAIKTDDGRTIPIMTFGPISIAPEYKRQGYGAALLRCSMEKAREMGAGALAITGNIDFYGLAGFVVSKTVGIRYEDDPDADYSSLPNWNRGFWTAFPAPTKTPTTILWPSRRPKNSTLPSRPKKS